MITINKDKRNYFTIMINTLNIFALTLILSFTSFAQNEEQNALLPDKQVVYYSVNLQNDSMPKFVENHMPDTSFIKTLSSDVLSGKVQAYESINPQTIYTNKKINPIEPSDAKSRMGYRSEKVEIEQQDGSIQTQTIESPIQYETINELLFTESWKFNSDKFTFHKEVLAVCPIREFIVDERGTEVKQTTFTLDYQENLKDKRDEEVKKRMKLVKQITYEISFNHIIDNKRGPVAPYFTEISKTNLLKTVFDKIEKGEVTAYDFQDSTKLTWKDVKTNMNKGKDTVQIKGENGEKENTVFQSGIRLQEIKSLYFIEKWFIDPESLLMEKEVMGMAPVRHYISAENQKEVKLIPFVVYFE